MSEQAQVTITRQDRYKFSVDFGPQFEAMLADEPPPLGEGAGPSPQHFLAVAVANCLSASLVFACNKYKEDPGALSATVTCTTGRNAQNRLRITGIDVQIALGVAPETLPHLQRALAQFEDFCTVTQSVRQGVAVNVNVTGPDGAVLA